MSETIKSWEQDLYNENLNGITWNTEPRRATNKLSSTKLSRKAEKVRERRIGLIMTGLTLLYVVTALLYTYRIDIVINLR